MAMTMTLRKRAPRSEQVSDHSPVNKRPKRPAPKPRVQRRTTRRRGRRSGSTDSQVETSSDEEEEVESEEEAGDFRKKISGGRRKVQIKVDSSEEEEEDGEDVVDEMPEYEKIREQRMRENREKMEKLGLFGLSHNFKPPILPRRTAPKKKPSVTRSIVAPYERARRSARVKEVVGRVSYFKDEGTLESMGISVPEGWAPEAYTEEHEKLLGDCEKPWTLYVDGYEDGERLYDPLNGKMCHQCRQRTVGHISVCRKCKSAHGQICGDCLYMRYGENVLEVNENINWACPCCREICNCSRCRRAKGWAPTVCVYQKVVEQGYKSIAHYLIQSRRPKNKPEENAVVDLDAKQEENAIVDVDANVNPEMTSYAAPQMIDSDDTYDGSTEAESEDYNSDSSEEAEPKKQTSVLVEVDDEDEGETVETSNVEKEMLDSDMKNDEDEGETVETSNIEKEMLDSDMNNEDEGETGETSNIEEKEMLDSDMKNNEDEGETVETSNIEKEMLSSDMKDAQTTICETN